MSNTAIKVTNLTKTFGELKAVVDFSLQVDRGEIVGFLGPNGSGKTTTIRMLCGLLTPSVGNGQCLGYDLITQSEQIKKRVGYMTQQFSLYPDLTVYENLDFAARLYAVKDRKTQIDAALDELGLRERKNQLAGTLSGGWKQRLALFTALLHHPDLLLLDEPTAGVDPKARRVFWDKIESLSESGVTVLVSTHYMDEAMRCTRLAYIDRGHLVTTGEPKVVIDELGLAI